MIDAPRETEGPQGKDPSVDAIQIDLYCLECGYNLRGLSGDPVRCPECAFLNPIGDVEIPAPIISKQLRRMETAPATSVLALFFLFALLCFWWLVLLDGGRLFPGMVYPAIATLGAGLAWLIGLVRFRASCLARPGWLGALFRYQLAALALGALIGGVFGSAGWIVTLSAGSITSKRGESTYCLTMPLTFALIVAAIRWGLRPLHRWLKAPMEQLQRQVAVKLARDRIRQELGRTRRWWESS